MKLLNIFREWSYAVILLFVFTGVLFILGGCSQAIKRPDSNILIINAAALHLKGYNILKDYDSNGNLLADAVPIIYPVTSLKDINGWACTDPQKGLPNIKTSLSDARAYIRDHCTCE